MEAEHAINMVDTMKGFDKATKSHQCPVRIQRDSVKAGCLDLLQNVGPKGRNWKPECMELAGARRDVVSINAHKVGNERTKV